MRSILTGCFLFLLPLPLQAQFNQPPTRVYWSNNQVYIADAQGNNPTPYTNVSVGESAPYIQVTIGTRLSRYFLPVNFLNQSGTPYSSVNSAASVTAYQASIPVSGTGGGVSPSDVTTAITNATAPISTSISSVSATATAALSAATSATTTAATQAAQISGLASATTTLSNAVATKIPATRTISINGTTFDLSQDRAFTVAGGSGGAVSSVNSQTGNVTIAPGASQVIDVEAQYGVVADGVCSGTLINGICQGAPGQEPTMPPSSPNCGPTSPGRPKALISSISNPAARFFPRITSGSSG